MIGPRLSDQDFFEKLDYENFDLKDLKEAKDASDYKRARHLFAEFVRGWLDVEKYFTIPGKEKNIVLTDSLLANAEKAVNHELTSVGVSLKFDGEVDWFANPTYNKYPEWTWQLSRHADLVCLSKAFRATGDQRYADACTELLLSWIKQAVIPEDLAHCNGSLCWRTIEIGIRLGAWSEIIHTFINNKAFTDDVITEIFKSVYEQEHCLHLRSTKGNWLILEMIGFSSSAFMYRFFKESQIWTDFAINKLLEQLSVQVNPDGFQYELSTSYHSVISHSYTSIIDTATVYGIQIPSAFYNIIEKAFMIYVKLAMANGFVPAKNDANMYLLTTQTEKAVRFFPNNEVLLWAATNGREGKCPEFNSISLPYSGMVLFRTGWGEDEVSAFFDVSNMGANKFHQHEDKLNLTISNNKKFLLVEGNNYAYDSSDIRNYVVSTRAHNTVRVDRLDQFRKVNFSWKPEYLTRLADFKFKESADYDIAYSFYDEGYGNDAVPLAKHERTVLFLKNPPVGKALFCVLDSLTSDKVHDYESMWHFDVNNPRITDFGFTSDEISAYIAGDFGSLQIVSGIYGQQEAQGWTCPNSRQGSNVPVPTLLHTTTGKCSKTVTVFSIHENGVSAVRSTSFDGEKLNIVFINGENVSITFDKF